MEQAGFRDVDVVDAAYLVRARTKDGDFALILVDPPGGPSATTGAGGRQSPSQQSGSQHSGVQSAQQTLRQNLQSAGFTDVAIVDAAYLVHAKTADGSTVRMTIDPSTTWQASPGSSRSQGSSGSSPMQPQRR